MRIVTAGETLSRKCPMGMNKSLFCIADGCMAWQFATPEDARPEEYYWVHDKEAEKEWESIVADLKDKHTSLLGKTAGEAIDAQFEEFKKANEAKLEAWNPPHPGHSFGWELEEKYIGEDDHAGICCARWVRYKTLAEQRGYCGMVPGNVRP